MHSVHRLAALVAVIAAASLVEAAAPGSAPLDAATIVKNSVAANTRDWDAAPRFDYMERDRISGKTVTYHVLMIAGSPYQLRIANPEHQSRDDISNEQQTIARVAAERRTETPEQRARRIRDYVTERERDHVMLEQIGDAFDFTLRGEQQRQGHRVYVIDATPRRGYAPPNAHARALTGMRGTLWIDTSTFNWVEVKASVVRPVSIFGFIATVEPGTAFELEKMPVAGRIWLPSHFVEHSRSRVLLLFSHGTNEDDRYWDYTPATNAPAADTTSGDGNAR